MNHADEDRELDQIIKIEKEFKDHVAQIEAVFRLAGIEILKSYELPNQYWPKLYVKYTHLRTPWLLLKTPYGLIEAGWRKRVMSIDWEDTPIREVLTEDNVTKSETYVHAWTYPKAVEYMTELRKKFDRLKERPKYEQAAATC